MDPELADVLRDLYLSYLDGTSLPALAERLHVAGVPSVRGGRWVTTTVRDMLDNGFAAGLVTSKGELMEGAHAPVITTEEWEAYVRRRDESRRTAPRHRQAAHATAGIGVCGLCGSKLVAASTGRDGPAYILRCGRKQSSGCGACPGVWIVRRSVEEAVIDWLRPLGASLTRAAVGGDHCRRIPTPSVTYSNGEPERRRGDLLRRIKRLTDAYEAGAIPLDDFTERRAGAQAALDVMSRDHGQQGAVRAVSAPAFSITDVIAQWEDFSAAAKRDVLAVLIDRIVVHPRGTEPRIQIEPRWTVQSETIAPIQSQ